MVSDDGDSLQIRDQPPKMRVQKAGQCEDEASIENADWWNGVVGMTQNISNNLLRYFYKHLAEFRKNFQKKLFLRTIGLFKCSGYIHIQPGQQNHNQIIVASMFSR